MSGGKVEVQWEAPDPVYPAPGVNHGVGFGSVFVIQYAEVDCGQSTDSLVWIQAQYPVSFVVWLLVCWFVGSYVPVLFGCGTVV